MKNLLNHKQLIFRIFLFSIPIILFSLSVNSIAAQQVFKTDFDDVVKVSTNKLSIALDHWFEFAALNNGVGGHEDGARMFIENEWAHSGDKSLGMEITNIDRSGRAEFSIYPHSIVEDEYTVNLWLRLDPELNLEVPGLDYNWAEILVLFSEASSNHTFYNRLTISQPDTSQSKFNLSLGGRAPYSFMGSYQLPNQTSTYPQYKLGELKNYPIKLGEWFNVRYYVKRHTNKGIIKVWIDNQQIFFVENIPTKISSNFYSTVAKIYHEPSAAKSFKIWIDDLEVYKGLYEPQIGSPESKPIGCKADYDVSGVVDERDFLTFSLNYKRSPIDCKYDIITDSTCQLRIEDFIEFASVYLDTTQCR